MPRTVAEIESEMSKLRAEGVHHSTKEMKTLRDELKSIGAGDAPVPSQETVDLAAVDLAAADIASIGTRTETLGSAIEVEAKYESADPLQSDEWAFIQKSIAEIEVKFDGQNGHITKDLYHNVMFKVTVWRMAREIVKEVGVGGEWPQWVALNRNDSNGAKRTLKPAPVRAAPVAEIPGGGVKAVTEGGMPMVDTAPPSDEVDAWKKNMATTILGDVGRRNEPTRVLPEPAAV